MSFWFDETKNRYRIRIKRRGREISETLVPGVTRGQAEERHTQLLRDFHDTAILGKRQGHTVAEALERLIAEALPPKHPHNVLSDVRALLPFVQRRPLEDIPDIAREYRAGARRQSRRKHPTPEQLAALKPLSIATLNRRCSVLRHAANLAYRDWHWLDRPLTVPLPEENNQRHLYYTRAQIPRLVRKCKLPQTRDMVMIASYSGLARGKIRHLDPRRQVKVVPDDQGRPIKVIDAGTRKNGAPIYVPIHPKIAAAITRAPFTTIGDRWIQRDFKQATAAIGIPDGTFHDTRHTAASWLLNAGVDLGTIADILGHRDTRTTQRYAHLALGAKRAAIRRLK